MHLNLKITNKMEFNYNYVQQSGDPSPRIIISTDDK